MSWKVWVDILLIISSVHLVNLLVSLTGGLLNLWRYAQYWFRQSSPSWHLFPSLSWRWLHFGPQEHGSGSSGQSCMMLPGGILPSILGISLIEPPLCCFGGGSRVVCCLGGIGWTKLTSMLWLEALVCPGCYDAGWTGVDLVSWLDVSFWRILSWSWAYC